MATNEFLERVRIPYILEMYIGDGQPYYVSMPNIPSSLEIVELPPISVRHTYGDWPIREHNVGTNFRIAIRGHVTSARRPFYGTRVKTKNSVGANLQAETYGPVQIVEEFNAFLTEYQELAKNRGTLYLQAGQGYKEAKQQYLLVFRDLVYDRHFYVEPMSINFKRNVQTSTCSAEFEFVFNGYKSAQASNPRLGGPYMGRSAPEAVRIDATALPPEAIAVKDYIKFAPSSQTSAVVASTYALTGTPLDRAYNVASRLETYIDQAQAAVTTGQRFFDRLRGPGRRLLQVSSRMRDLQYAIGDLADAPRRLLADYFQAAEIFLSAVIGIRQVIPIVFSPEYYMGGFSAPFLLEKLAQDVYADAASRAGVAGLNARRLQIRTAGAQVEDPLIDAPASSGAVLLDTPQLGFSVYEMKAGETWLDVAASFNVPWLGWQAIAAFNGAFVPELKADGSPLQAGDMVKVPLAPSTQSAVKSKEGQKAGMDLVYGTDIYLNPETGDWELAAQPSVTNTAGTWTRSTPPSVDFVTASGLRNIEQVLRMRLTQAAGSWKGQPGVGIEGLEIGATVTPAATVRTAASARGQLAQDPRFVTVRNLEVVSRGNIVSVSADVGVIGRDKLVNVVAPAMGL